MGAYLAAPKTEKVSVSETSGEICYGASCMQGWRVTMEDAHCCLLDFDEKATLFGVYDGHGGSEVAEFVAKHLQRVIQNTDSYKKGNLKQSLIDAFLGIDQEIISEEGMSELKVLAGMNDVSDAEDDDEAELLSKEASMPMEQLLAKLKQQGYETYGRPVDTIEGEEDSEDEIDEDSEDSSEEEEEEEEEEEKQPDDQEQNGEVNPLSAKNDKIKESSLCDKSDKGKEDAPGIENGNSNSESNGTQKEENADGESTGEKKTSDVAGSQHKQQDEEKEEIEDGEMEEREDGEMEGGEDIEIEGGEDGEMEEREEGDDGAEDEEVDNDQDGQVMPHSDEVGFDSGTTAIVAMTKDKHLIVANVGDSRCVLCRSGVALDMSVDHKPDDDKELSRIEKAGGKVTREGRVNGGLNLSRALGDHSYKLRSELAAHEQMISAFPDVKETTLTESDEFMVIACDGIWNVMSSQEVIDFVADRLKKQKIKGEADVTVICEELFDACLAPDTTGDGSGCDNMTCVIVLFKPHLGSKETVDTEMERKVKRKGDEIENNEESEQSSKRIKTDD